jgi:hypothetical protein
MAGFMTEHPAPLAIVRTTDDLRQLFRQRVAYLGISLETLDAIAGLPVRYSSKLLALEPSKHMGPISFESLLGALGLMLVAWEDAEALRRVQHRLAAAPLQRHDATGWRAACLNEQPALLSGEQVELAAGMVWRADGKP